MFVYNNKVHAHDDDLETKHDFTCTREENIAYVLSGLD